MTRFYTKQDSDEVRKTYFEALKKNPCKQKMLITKKEWIKYELAGADMSRFEILKDFLLRIRKEEIKRLQLPEHILRIIPRALNKLKESQNDQRRP